MPASYLIHYGIKGQKHGVRRFQNEDGSYTEEGKERYGIGDILDRQRRGPEPTKPPKWAKSGPYEEYTRKRPYENIRERHKKIRSEFERIRKAETKDMISNGQEDAISKKDKQKLKENLKEGYKNRMNGALSTAFAGYSVKNIGVLASLFGHRTVGRIMHVAGNVMIGSSVFSAAANTGAYFIGKAMVDQGKIKPEDVRGGKK